MGNHRWWHVVKVVLFVVVAVAVGGAAVMLLWNWLMPALFEWRSIDFWQAVGLLALSRILLGGWGRHRHWRGRLAERWERMSDDDRERFRATLRRGRCGRERPAGEPSASGAS